MSVGIVYTEQRENHGSMILDGACYSAIIQFCRVILSRTVEPYKSQSFFDEYCLICRVLLSLGIYRRPCISPINAPLLIQYVICNIFPRLLTFPLGRLYQHRAIATFASQWTICASLFYTHYWPEVVMLKVSEVVVGSHFVYRC